MSLAQARPMRTCSVLSGLLLLTGCAVTGCTADDVQEGAGSARADLEQPEPGESAPEDPGTPDEVVLAERADGARLVGEPTPLIPNADPEPSFLIRPVGVSFDGLDGARVLAAHFVDEAVVTIGADHVLRVHDARGVRELDTDAYGPISVMGPEIAYVRGRAPSLEVARAHVTRGEVSQLTQDMAPAWLPALTPDGGAVVFVSGVTGSPRLYRVDRGGAVLALPETSRTPSAAVAPHFEGQLLVFRDHLGVASIDLDTGHVDAREGAE